MDAGIKKDTYRLLFPKEYLWIFERTYRIQKDIYEIRIRCGAPLCFETAHGRYYAGNDKTTVKDMQHAFCVTMQEVQLWLQHLCRHSLYAFREELVQGYFTVCGGHRVGVVGQVVWGEDGRENLKYINSINIRIAHEAVGCAKEVLPELFEGKKLCSTLIVSPPMCGKTTLLRDLIRCISDGINQEKPLKVGVVDERGEIAACYMGEAQNQVGLHTDIYTNCCKSEGVYRLLRSMSPQVIAMDELGSLQEAEAIRNAFYMGCTILATAHADGLESLYRNTTLNVLLGEGKFERIVLLEHTNHFDATVHRAVKRQKSREAGEDGSD